jgi:sugar O-acyltransferase (sialic acid O-acetyltransferase NeuD family)
MTEGRGTLPRLIIVGSSGHAAVIIDIFNKCKTHKIIGLLDDYSIVGEIHNGYSILGSVSSIDELYERGLFDEVFVAVGSNSGRRSVVNRIREILPDLPFPNAIHPFCQLSENVNMGSGNCIMAGAIINSRTVIDDFCIINTNSSLDHDNHLSSFSSLAPGCCTGGYVDIGELVQIGIGSTIRDKIRVGRNSIIGAGSLLLNDCQEDSLMYGQPAKLIRKLYGS